MKTTHQFLTKALLSIIFCHGTPAFAQSSDPQASEPIIVPASPSGFDVNWFGKADTAYFVQFSTDLVTWEYLPFTYRGIGESVPFWYECPNQSEMMFLRIRWLDNAPLIDADGDGVSDTYEVTVLGSDPLVAEDGLIYLVDQDGDGILDVDEQLWGLDPQSADDPDSDLVQAAGPLLLTQVYSSNYHFSEAAAAQGQQSPGTWTRQLWNGPEEGREIAQPITLAEFRQSNSQFTFPLNGTELERQYSFAQKLLDLQFTAIPNDSVARMDTDQLERQESIWRSTQTAYMLKLPSPAEEEQDYPFLEVPTYSIKETLVAYQVDRLPDESDLDYRIRLFGISEHGVKEDDVALRTFTIPQGSRVSQIIEQRDDVEQVPSGVWRETVNYFIPILQAPDVLAVNSDFDEGRIDSATGYAIPDCDDIPDVDRKTGSDNTAMRLDTEREHLDGLYLDDERVTDDLHQGWFGVHPKAMSDDFWDGAEVTIKKLDRIDPDTGRPESGQVRFYAKWGDPKFGDYYGIETYDFETLEAKNLVTEGINGRPNESVYGSKSEIPIDAVYWMEGVRPGKITLEWRLKKGSIDVAYEQTFLVETQQSEYQWRADLQYLVRLQTHDDPVGYTYVNAGTQTYGPFRTGFGGEVNINTYIKSSGNFSYPDRAEVLSEYYDFYRQCWDIDKALDWVGVARAGVSGVVAGVSDMQYAISDFSLVVNLIAANSGVSGIEVSDIQEFQDGLFSGAFDIFQSLAWQHYAFLASGMGALEYLEEQRAPHPKPEVEKLLIGHIEGWRLLAEASARLLDGANLSAVSPLLIEGGRLIAEYEQRVVAQPAFERMALAGGGKFIGLVSSDIAKPPLPECGLFYDFHQGQGNLARAEDRWSWIDAGFSDSVTPPHAQELDGPLKTWSLYSEGERENAVQPLLEDKAPSYSNLNTLFFPVRIHDGLEAPLKQ